MSHKFAIEKKGATHNYTQELIGLAKEISERELTLKGKHVGPYRELAARIKLENGYGNDPATLALGVCEEAGELGKAINWYHNPLYIHNPRSKAPGTAEVEVRDVLIYLAHLCNALDLDIEF